MGPDQGYSTIKWRRYGIGIVHLLLGWLSNRRASTTISQNATNHISIHAQETWKEDLKKFSFCSMEYAKQTSFVHFVVIIFQKGKFNFM